MREHTGSSPLARGLRPNCRAALRSEGDHPRSRGVYADCGRSGASSPGSSPLARGLQQGGEQLINAGRIIPARAGFTTGGRAAYQRRPDHPRSRGVYHCCPLRSSPSWGSSPLARGLRSPLGLRDHSFGIIPARAGFTLVRLLTCALDGDHPRSRGVYDHPQTRLLRRDGSSPLARGLRSPVKLKAEFIRIIPARAGFTRAGDCSGAQCRDHPRSRGVYAVPWDCGTIVSGSSPLARGLRCIHAPPDRRSGIIPARAGFT